MCIRDRGVGSLAGYSSGSLGAYSGTGTWTLSATDSYGDGGILLTVAESLGSFTGMLTADAFDTEDKKSGFVSSSDTSDVWAMTIPDGYAANITLDWPANADLDIYIYQNSDLTGLLAYSWYDQPEFIDLGGSVTNTTVFIKVEYWYWGSVDLSLIHI